MARSGRGKRLSWLGWSAAIALLIAIPVAAFVWWAFSSGSVASLDRLDAVFGRARGVKLIGRETWGQDAAQKIALYEPEGAAPPGGFPLVVFIHGGSWHSGDPYDYAFVARTMAQRGYATALVGYRLNRAGRFPAMLSDCAGGTRAALALAAGKPIDTARIVLMGHSAGGYNAAMLTLDPRWLREAGVDAGAIKGAALLSAPLDFYPFDRGSYAEKTFGEWPDPGATQPVTYAHAGAPPLLIVQGTADTTVRPRNATALAAAMTAAGQPTRAVLIAGMDHIDPVITLARPFDRDRRVSDALFAFLHRVLSASSPVQGPKA